MLVGIYGCLLLGFNDFAVIRVFRILRATDISRIKRHLRHWLLCFHLGSVDFASIQKVKIYFKNDGSSAAGDGSHR